METIGKVPTTQERLKSLKDRQQQLSVLLTDNSLTGNQERFIKWYRESVELRARIFSMEESIASPGPSGMVGEYSARASMGPENRIRTTKKR